MEELTEEQLDALGQYYRRTLQDYIDKPHTRYIRALIAEVRKRRKVVEIDGRTTKYAATIVTCPDCKNPLYADDKPKFCDECGVRFAWKD